MTLHTPRRRVSSRTKQRCRVIKNFFCKTLGSQIKDRTHSSIEISITDLKQKISGIETQLEKISKHCHDLTPRDNLNKFDDKPLLQDELSTHETKVLYKATNSRFKKSDESDISQIKSTMINNQRYENELESQHENVNKIKKKDRERQAREEEYSCYKKMAAPHLESIRQSPRDRKNIAGSSHKRKHKKEYHRPTIILEESYSNLNRNDVLTYGHKNKKLHDKNSSRRKYTEMDQDFISNIIQKQYKPVQLFGRKESDLTQFSVPMCRDREFSTRDKICFDKDLCSCCFDQCRKNDNNSDVTDMRSVCDARLYSSKRRNRHKKATDDYNNSEYYDLVPVKEKSSPKSRKKYEENFTTARQCYKEVPPSPKSQRPRLNLKATVYNNYDDMIHIKKCTSTHSKSRINTNNHSSSDMIEIAKPNKTVMTDNNKNSTHPTQNVRKFANENKTENDLINQQSDGPSDKTLGEIKDLLQTFLTVIKKDSIHDENNILPKSNGNNQCDLQNLNKQNYIPTNCNNYSAGNVPCNPPIMPIYPNTCCYPVMTVYPVNYLENGCLFPTSTKRSNKRLSSSNNDQDNGDGNDKKDTRELIKEIYEIVTRSPKAFKKSQYPATHKHRQQNNYARSLRTRSECNSSIASRCNPDLRQSTPMCVSKSCEAIGSRREYFKYCNASVSDTVLEGLSVEATHSSTEFELESNGSRYQTREKKANILKDILKPWKWGKKKKDVIEELSESESTIEVNIDSRSPPFRQNIMDYAMHEQEFYHPPPVNERRFSGPLDYPNNPPYPNFEYPPDYANRQQPYYNNNFDYPPGYPNKRQHQHYSKVRKPQAYPKKQNYSRFDRSPQFSPPLHNYNVPTSPYPSYDHNYHSMPQVPLCLKEIEVKSMGTQSERKMSLFKKLAHKVKVQQDEQQNRPPTKATSGMFGWKTLQRNAKREIAKDFTLNTQHKLAKGDLKMRYALIKKLFYKRNPLSPRNLIMRTLLGNDPSSYGNPPKIVKPKLFV